MILGAFCSIVSKSSWVIAVTNDLESTGASTVRLFSKYRDTQSTSSFRFRTTVDVNGRYIWFVCSSRTNTSSISGVGVVRGGVVVSPLRVVSTCCSVFWVLEKEFLEQSRSGTGSFPVWFLEGCSVATTWFCGWVPLVSNVWLATFVFKVEPLFVLFKLSWFVTISVGCCQTTSEIGGCLVISFVSGLSRASPEWRLGVVSLKFGLQLRHSRLSYFEHFSVELGFVLPVVSSVEAVCLLRLLQGSFSLWSGWFYHMSHRVGRQV